MTNQTPKKAMPLHAISFSVALSSAVAAAALAYFKVDQEKVNALLVIAAGETMRGIADLQNEGRLSKIMPFFKRQANKAAQTISETAHNAKELYFSMNG